MNHLALFLILFAGFACSKKSDESAPSSGSKAAMTAPNSKNAPDVNPQGMGGGHTRPVVGGDTKPAPLAAAGGFGPFAFGMSREAVKKVTKYAPYKDVKVTGGLESGAFEFAGKKGTISFVFDMRGLRRIQVWAYEGKSVPDAVKRFGDVFVFLRKAYGAIESPTLKLTAATDRATVEKDALAVAQSVKPGAVLKIQMRPKSSPGHTAVFSTLFVSPRGIYCFLYFSRPKKQ